MRAKNFIPQLPEGGKIKIGGKGEERKAKGGGTYRAPEKYDHFVITGTRRNTDGDLLPDQKLMDSLPKDPDGKLTRIPIRLCSDDVDAAFLTSNTEYVGKKCVVRCDGNERVQLPEGDVSPCQLANGCKCKPYGKLTCTIVGNSVLSGSTYTWRTTSRYSIQRMLGSLDAIKDKAQMLELTLRGLPLWLVLSPAPTEKFGTIYLCHVELRVEDLINANKEKLLLTASPSVTPLLPEAEEPDDQEEFAEEFHPPEPASKSEELKEVIADPFEDAPPSKDEDFKDDF